MEKLKIALSIGCQLFAEGVVAELSGSRKIEVACHAPNADMLLARMGNQSRLDVVVFDVTTLGTSSFKCIEKLQKAAPKTPILILSCFSHRPTILGLWRMGIRGFLISPESGLQLEEAVLKVHSTGNYFSTCVVEMIDPDQAVVFTEREIHVLHHLTAGLDNAEIAEEMHVLSSTVNAHLRNIRAKTNLGSSRKLMHYAIQNGFCAPPIPLPPKSASARVYASSVVVQHYAASPSK